MSDSKSRLERENADLRERLSKMYRADGDGAFGYWWELNGDDVECSRCSAEFIWEAAQGGKK